MGIFTTLLQQLDILEELNVNHLDIRKKSIDNLTCFINNIHSPKHQIIPIVNVNKTFTSASRGVAKKVKKKII